MQETWKQDGRKRGLICPARALPVSRANLRMEPMPDYLVMDGDDEELELEFDLDAIARMSVEERYRAAIRLSLVMIEMMERHGHREPATVLQRPAR